MSILRIQLNSFGSEKFENSNCSPAEHKGTFEYLPPNFKLSFRFESIVRHYGKLNDPALLRTVAQNYMEEVIDFPKFVICAPIGASFDILMRQISRAVRLPFLRNSSDYRPNRVL